MIKGIDLTGYGSSPMGEDPMPLYKCPSRGHMEKGWVPHHNAVLGRWRKVVECRDCGERFGHDQDAVNHSAEFRHVVHRLLVHEVVPVDLHDEWQTWDDGAGVCFHDREPDKADDHG